MPLYDSPDLLALFNELTGRASSDRITDPQKYVWLARAQLDVIVKIASVAPQALYPKVGNSALPTMSTVDQNVFTFGSGATVIAPFGKAQIYKTLSAIPDRPLVPGYDYIDEVTQIRLPNNRKYSGPLYYRGVVLPTDLSATVPPALQPIMANELTAIRAAQTFAEGGGIRNGTLADRMALKWNERWPSYCLLWKTQFRGGGALMLVTAKDLTTPLP